MSRQLVEVDGVLQLADYDREVRLDGDVLRITETVRLLASARTVVVRLEVPVDGPPFFDLDGATEPDAQPVQPAPRGTT